jgi:hypothetical protein
LAAKDLENRGVADKDKMTSQVRSGDHSDLGPVSMDRAWEVNT